MAKPDKKKEEAPVDGADGDGEAKPKKKLPVMLIAIAGAAVLVLGGGGAGAWFMFLAPKHPPAAADAAKKAPDKKKDRKKDDKKEGGDKVDPKTQPTVEDGPNGVTYFKLPETIANIQAADGHNAYLKLDLTFECPDEDTADALKEQMPVINDLLQGFIRELRPEDLSGSQGNYMLRLEILRRVNLAVAPQKINAVLIEQMVIN